MENGIRRDFFCPRERQGYLACNTEFAVSVQGLWCNLCHIHFWRHQSSATETKLLPWQTGGGSPGSHWNNSSMKSNKDKHYSLFLLIFSWVCFMVCLLFSGFMSSPQRFVILFFSSVGGSISILFWMLLFSHMLFSCAWSLSSVQILQIYQNNLFV